MLRSMGFVAQWRALANGLPEGWQETRLRLTLASERDADRAARLLGPLGPGRSANTLLVSVTSRGAAGPGAFARLLERLDARGIAGSLELTADDAVVTEAAPPEAVAASLAGSWDALVGRLPADWSDLLCLVLLRSSDDLGRAALAMAPLNPSRHGAAIGFRFRVAHRFGYGAAPEMARRCLSRLDEQAIPGSLSLLEALSDTRPVLTQGPTFVFGGRAV
jgi:hypothetical protein